MLLVWQSLVCLRSVANGQTTNMLVKFIMLKEHSKIYEIGKFLIKVRRNWNALLVSRTPQTLCDIKHEEKKP